MTNLELVLNILAEATTTEISKEKKPKTFQQNKKVHCKVEQLLEIQEKKLKLKQVKKL